MAGTSISLFRKTDYTFIVAAAASEVVLVPLVDTTNLTSGVVLWRVYSLTIGGSSSLNLALRNVMTGPDDPNTVLPAPAANDIGTAVATQNQLYATSLTAPVGRYLRVLAKVGAGTAGASVIVTMAADLLMRDT